MALKLQRTLTENKKKESASSKPFANIVALSTGANQGVRQPEGWQAQKTMKKQKKGFIVHFQDNFHSINQELKKLERLSNLPTSAHIQMVQETTVPRRPSIWPFESTALEELCKADGLTQQHFCKASEDLRKAGGSDHHRGELCTSCPALKGCDENVCTEDGKLDMWPKCNYQEFQKMTDHATTAWIHYHPPKVPDIVFRQALCGRLHKAVSGPCQGYREFLQDDFPPGHGETSELWKPSKHLPAVTAAQQLSCSQPRHLSTDVCGAFSFSPTLQAKLPPVSCASQNDLPHDILPRVSASLSHFGIVGDEKAARTGSGNRSPYELWNK
ncbi:hypothetical protein U0070_027632, partial [Myodes glareolus]